MQCVGIVLPTQTLPWQNSIVPVDFTLPDVSFGVLIYVAFFLSVTFISPLLFLIIAQVLTMGVIAYSRTFRFNYVRSPGRD